MAGLACGISLGTKPTLWPYVGLVSILAIAKICREPEVASRLALRVTTLLLCMAIPSVFWFGRAFATTGNPLFPLEVSVAGNTILNGVPSSEITPIDYDLNRHVRSRWEWLAYPWIEYKSSGYAFGVDTGLGPVWATFVPIAFGYALYLAWIDRHRRLLQITLCLLPIMLVGWWIGLRRMPRFGIPIIALSSVTSSLMFERFMLVKTKTFSWLMVLAVTVACVLSAFIPVHALLGRFRTAMFSRAAYYCYPAIIDDLPEGSGILGLGGGPNAPTMNFPLAGKSLSNRVIPAEWAPKMMDAAWLVSKRIDYVVDREPFSKTGSACPWCSLGF